MQSFSRYRPVIIMIGSPIIAYILVYIIAAIFIVNLNETINFTTFFVTIPQRIFTFVRLQEIISLSIPYFIAGLAVSITFQAGLINYGIDGQYFVGGLCATMIALFIPWSPIFIIPLMIITAIIGGGIWASLIIGIKRLIRLHEVFCGLIFNVIAIVLCRIILQLIAATHESDIGSLTSVAIPARAQFSRTISIPGVIGTQTIDITLLIAIFLGIIIYLLLYRHRIGFGIRAVGSAPHAAIASGIRDGRTHFIAFLLSGCIAGLVALQEIFTVRGVYAYDLRQGIGLIAIFIAIIARNNPIAIGFISILFVGINIYAHDLQLFVPSSAFYNTNTLFCLFFLFTIIIRTVAIRLFRHDKPILTGKEEKLHI